MTKIVISIIGFSCVLFVSILSQSVFAIEPTQTQCASFVLGTTSKLMLQSVYRSGNNRRYYRSTSDIARLNIAGSHQLDIDGDDNTGTVTVRCQVDIADVSVRGSQVKKLEVKFSKCNHPSFLIEENQQYTCELMMIGN